MSRILRRPMFRGGPVNSYNTGIASGLGDEGYADGGRVGFQGGDLVTRPGIGSRIASSAKYYNPFTEAGIGNIGRKIFTGTPGMISRGASLAVGTYPILSTLAVPAATIGGLAYLNRPINEAELDFMRENREIFDKETTDPSLYEGYFKGKAEAREKGEKAGQPKFGFFETFTKEPKKTETQPKEKSELDKLKEFYESREKKLKDEYDKKIAGLTKVTKLTEEEDITKQTELYQKLLGGEEARAQAGYDALLAAAPAFFKGKNLREAAPQVLESINKSGAFDKPRDIKQAAAQLAIQRQIMKDKATAEERSRLEYLRLQQGFKQPSITDRLVKLGAQENFGGNLPSDIKKAVPGKFYVDANEKLIKVIQDPKTKQIDFIEYPD
jgi:hypothetical protein